MHTYVCVCICVFPVLVAIEVHICFHNYEDEAREHVALVRGEDAVVRVEALEVEHLQVDVKPYISEPTSCFARAHNLLL